MEIWGLCFLPNKSHPSEETVRKTNVIQYCIHVETKKKKKKIQMNLFTKQKQTHRFRERIYGHQGGKGGVEG